MPLRSILRKLQLKSKTKKESKIIRPHFDEGFYIRNNEDVILANSDPLTHYIQHGWKEGRDPSPHFSTSFYVKFHQDVADSGVNPFVHYVQHGRQEGRIALASSIQEDLQDSEEADSKPVDTALLRRELDDAKSAFEAERWSDTQTLWEAVSRKYSDFRGIASTARYYSSLARRLADLGRYRDFIDQYTTAKLARELDQSHPRIAVYMAMAGRYDSLKPPDAINNAHDYYVFSDHPIDGLGIFEIRPISYFAADATRTARFVKTHPHILLPNYDVAIWIDTNIMIVEDLDDLVTSFIKSGKGVAVVPHPHRTTIREEVEAAIKYNKDIPDLMMRQMAAYEAEGFETSSLIESNFMMFDLRQPNVLSFLDNWWTQISRHSRRDQLSLNYALAKSGVTVHELMPRPTSIRTHPSFAMVPHDSGSGAAQKLAQALAPGRAIKSPYESRRFSEVKSERLADVRRTAIDIVVCCHNALEDIRLCLASIETHRGENQTLILIDDGSFDETRLYLEQFAASRAWVTLRRSDAATGYTRAANRGLALSRAPFVVLLNSDTIVTEDWAEKLVDAICSTPGAGIAGPLSNAASYQSIPDTRGRAGQTAINELPDGLSANDMNLLCEEWAPCDLFPRVPLIHGFCFALTRTTLEAVGLFDEQLFPRGYGEENDYCLRATDAGIGLVVATNTFVFHAKSKSYSSDARIANMKAGGDALRSRHGEARIQDCVAAMAANPLLAEMRATADSTLFAPLHSPNSPSRKRPVLTRN